MAGTMDMFQKSIESEANESNAKNELSPLEMAQTLHMTQELLQKRPSSNVGSEREKRFKATIEAIQNKVMDSVLPK